jgi:hypothetical protein
MKDKVPVVVYEFKFDQPTFDPPFKIFSSINEERLHIIVEELTARYGKDAVTSDNVIGVIRQMAIILKDFTIVAYSEVESENIEYIRVVEPPNANLN